VSWQQEQIIDRKGVTTKAVDSRLSNCPFCGSPGMLGFRPAMQEHFAMCSDPGCGAYLAKCDNEGFPTDRQAVAAWNRRPVLVSIGV
jgi:hypothetical protein